MQRNKNIVHNNSIEKVQKVKTKKIKKKFNRKFSKKKKKKQKKKKQIYYVLLFIRVEYNTLKSRHACFCC